MAGSLTGQDATTDNDEAITVIADGQTGSGVQARVSTISGVNRLAVDATLTGGAPGTVPSVTNALRIKDMNASTGGIARETTVGTSFTDVYNEDGSGILFGFSVTLEGADKEWEVKLLVDSVEIFTIDTEDANKDDRWHLEIHNDYMALSPLGIVMRNNKSLIFHNPAGFGMTFSTNVTVQVRTTTGSKKFRAGLITISGV